MLRITMVKEYPVKGDLAGNTARLSEILESLAERQPDVVITPEGWLDGRVATQPGMTTDRLREYAVTPETSPEVAAAAAAAARLGTWLILGCTRWAPEGLFNSALILNRAGQYVDAYDKVHVRGTDHVYTRGSRLPVFESDFGTFGVMICADRRWPETVRTLALQGARVIFNPTYGSHTEMNVQLMRTRSLESEVFIAFTHPGQSLVTGPQGVLVLDLASSSKSYGFAELDLEIVDRKRQAAKSYLKDMRPEVYWSGQGAAPALKGGKQTLG